MNAADPKFSKHAAAITAACYSIEHGGEAPSLAELAASAGMSPFHFHRVFKQVTGITPKEFATTRRAGRVRESLHKNSTVTGAYYEAGYNSSSRFYEKSSGVLGMLPQVYAKGGKGETIRFALDHYRGQMSEMARKLGIGRSTLYRKMKELGLDDGQMVEAGEAA